MSFVQQFDPFTGEPSFGNLSGGQPTYGPAVLSVLEYISRIYGIHREENNIYWGLGGPESYEYAQVFGDDEYKVRREGKVFECFLNGRKLITAERGGKIITDLSGRNAEMIAW